MNGAEIRSHTHRRSNSLTELWKEKKKSTAIAAAAAVNKQHQIRIEKYITNERSMRTYAGTNEKKIHQRKQLNG